MDRSARSPILHGAVGGALAGLVVALWFLSVDLVAGSPLRTPHALGELLFAGVAAAGAGPGTLVPLYTLVHLAVFVVLGAGAAAFLAATGVRAGWLSGAFFGVGVLDAVHYGGLLLVGAPVLNVLPWPHVIGANVAGGLALMAYLRRATSEERPVGIAALVAHPLVRDGIVAGLWGATALAVWFLLLDLAAGVPFRTPAALGSAVFLGATSPESVRVTAGIVAAYTVVHAALFVLAGLAFVAVARQLERLPALAYVVLLGGILMAAVSLGVLVSFASWVLGALPAWGVGVGNLLAVGAMGAWVWRRHPVLRERVARRGFASTA